MRNSKKGFIKQYVSSILVTIMVLGIILPNISLNVQASHNPAGPVTVTAGNSPRVDFTHKHKGKGTYYTNKKVTRSQTSVNGYSQSGGCYTNKVQHEHYGNPTSGGECYDATPVYKIHTHGDSCKVYADRYTMKDPSSGLATWDAVQTGSYTCPVCGVTHSGIYGYYLASYGDYRRYTPVADRNQWIQLGFKNGVDGSNHQVGTGSGDGWKDIWMYYDKKEDEYVYVTSGGKYYSCAYSNKIDGGTASGTYWTGTYSCPYGSGTSKTVTTTEIDHYNYTLKSDCGYYRDALYKLNCGMGEGDIYAQSWCGANDNNYLSYEVTKPASIPSNVSYAIHVKMSRPDGTEITSARTYYDNWTTQEVKKGYQITELGDGYTVYIHIITKIGGMNVDDDEVTYTYNAVPKNATVKLIRNWYADDNTVLATWSNVKRGQEPNTCTVPTREGYTFVEYTKPRTGFTPAQVYYDENGFIKNNPWCPLDGNNGNTIYLFAQWQPNGYRITYETNNKDLEALTTDSQVQVYEYATDDLGTPAKTYSGYTFLGWYANADGTADGDVQWFDENGKCVIYPSGTGTGWGTSHDVYLYAKYRADNYTLYYNNNKEDNVEKNSEVIPYDSDYELPDKTHTDYEGYTFKGWFDSVLGKVFGTDGANTDSGKWKYTQDIKAKATYEANTYTVNYYAENTAEETKTDKSKDFVYDSANPTIDAQKVYDGWTSDGYYNGTEKIFNADGTFAKGSKWNIASDITVTPKFTPKKYTLNYNLNKEDPVTKISKQIEFNSAYGLTAEDKANRQNYTGYTFKGWYDGTTQIFDADGNNTDTGVWRRLTNVNAKATYEANSYTVTYYVENPVEETKVNHTDTFVYDQTTGLKLSTAVKSYNGWVLEGFYNGTTKVFNADGTYVGNKWDIAQNITVTPKWTPNEYTLTYTLDKEGTLSNSQTIYFNDTYGLTDADKTNRKSYKGYTFNGWFTADGNLFFNPDGSNTDSGKWRYLNDVTATAQYTANSYKVFYNTEESGSPTNVLNVTYDASYTLPATDVASVPVIPGYTFDGWYLSTDTSVKVFNTNGSSVKATYDYDSDITVLVKYHKNKYTIHFNNTDIDDTDLDKSQTVTFDSSYLDIAQAPYKTGYVFDGHTIVVGGTQTFIWDGKGDKTHAIWDFVLGADGTEVNAYKNYSPKVFNIDIGNDFDGNNVIDSIEDTKTATYDATYFDLTVPAKIDGYTFDGYYLINPTGTSKFIATYDEATDTLTKESNTWIYDDGINWVNDPHNNLTLVRKWHKNIYTVRYNNTTVADTNLDKAEVVTFGTPYPDIDVSPYKTGYLFDGHTVNTEYVWGKDGKATHTTWDFAVGTDNDTVDAYKHYTAKTFVVEVGRDFDNDGVLDSVEQTENITYDGNYGSLDFTVPAKIDGYTFDGWYLIEKGEYIVDKTGAKKSATWKYDDGKDWNTEAYDNTFHIALKWHKNTYTVNYNDTTVDDTHLDKNQTVVFDTPYQNILISPYKTGYIFDGHQIGSDYVWDKEGKATHTVWDFAVGDDNQSVDALKHYTAKTFTVNVGPDFDNDGVLDSIEQTETITYDGTYGLLTFTVPTAIDGYTFDGWYLIEQDKYIVDNKGVKASATWTYDDGKDWNTETYNNVFNIALKWHRNTYKVRYNDTTVDDDTLNKSKTVVFDTPYTDIAVSPYKTGYIFDGHQIGTEYVWNKEGKATHTTWDFPMGADNNTVDAFKHYTAKTFTVNVGRDFDNDGVLDSIEQTETITYDGNYGALTFDVPADIDGYTFDGWYLLEKGQYIVDKTGIKASATWTYDDGKDWNKETYNNVFNIALKWHPNTYNVRYNNTTVADTELDKAQVVVFDNAYPDIAVSPYKTGYIFDGHQIGTDYVWGKDGKATHTVWDFPMGADNNTVDALKHYTAKTFTVNVGRDFNNDGALDSIEQTETIAFDGNYGSLTFDVPEKINGYTFDGWYLLEKGEYIVDNKGTKKSGTWTYDDGKDWNTETYNNVFNIALKWHSNTYTVKYNDTDIADTNLNKSKTCIFDTAYTGVKTQPKKYGYTGIGWYFKDVMNTEQQIFAMDGTPTKSTFTFDLGTDNTVIETYKKYTPNPHTITVKKTPDDPNPKPVPVVFDDPYTIPNPDEVPDKPGYTFDGWSIVEPVDPIPGVPPYPEIFVYPDGKPVDPEYHIDEDITIEPVYHKNTYTVKYNNTEYEDTNLDKSQTVVFDNPYSNIEVSPYLKGYIFEGHYIDKDGIAKRDSNYMLWDRYGKVTHPIYDFVTGDPDNAVIKTYKVYYPKTVTVNVGIDYNNDNVIDEKSLLPSGQTYKKTFTMIYDDIVPDSEFPNLKESGLTFDGWYVICNGKELGCAYKYDKDTDTLVKQSNTWIWDDGKDWNKESESEFIVVGRFIHDKVTVNIQTETDTKVGNKKIGEKADYKFDTKTREEYFDLEYKNDTVPTKRGYTFTGYIVSPKNDNEKTHMWDKDAKVTSETFRWLPTTGKDKVEVISTFTPNQIKGSIPAKKYDPKKDETTDNPITIDQTYDKPYPKLPTIPEKKGYDYDGITDKDGNPVWDEKGEPKQEVWEYLPEDIDEFIIKWKPKTYILVYPDKTEVTVTFDKAVNTNKTDSKSGHTFKGWTFNHNGKTIHGFGSDGKYNGTVWTYDFGESGTKIPLSPVFDVNTYQVTVKPMTVGYDNYTLELAYGSGYPDVAIPVKKGYNFKGYDLEFSSQTGELSKQLWNELGKAVEPTFNYDHNISVLGQYAPKTFYLHLGNEKVIKVIFDKDVEKGVIISKDGTEDDDYKYTYDFKGWYMKNGTKLFDENGMPVYRTWTLDLGNDGTHIYLDGLFDENKTEKPKPEDKKEPKEEIKEEPSEKPSEETSEITVIPETKPGKNNANALQTLKKAAIITGLTLAGILLIIGLLLLLLLLLFLLGEVSLVYRYDYNRDKKKLDSICFIKRFKKDERQDNVKFYVTLKEKYYNALLDTKSNLISVKLAPNWVDRHHGKDIRIQCKDIYDDFKLANVKRNKGDLDRGFIEVHLTQSFNN